MKSILTFLLIVSIALLPFEVRAQEAPPKQKFALPAVIAGCLLVVVASAAIYVVARVNKKADDSTKCKNEACGKPVPLDAEWCPACGHYYRCKDCRTEFPKDATQCPNCEEKKPKPEPVPNKVQAGFSANGGMGGLAWVDVPEPMPTTFSSGPKVMHFPTWEAFWEFVAQPDVLWYYPVSTNATSGFFRIAGE